MSTLNITLSPYLTSNIPVLGLLQAQSIFITFSNKYYLTYSLYVS